MLKNYKKHVDERAKQGIPPLPLDADQTSELIDSEARKIIDDCYSAATKILKDNIDKLHSMAKALVEFETLDSDQIEDIMAGASPRSNDDGDSGNKKKKSTSKPSITDPANQT